MAEEAPRWALRKPHESELFSTWKVQIGSWLHDLNPNLDERAIEKYALLLTNTYFYDVKYGGQAYKLARDQIVNAFGSGA